MITTESLTLNFRLHSDSNWIDVTTDWNTDNVSPLTVIKALRDLADDEERHYLTWIGKREGLSESLKVMQEERNREVKNGVN